MRHRFEKNEGVWVWNREEGRRKVAGADTAGHTMAQGETVNTAVRSVHCKTGAAWAGMMCYNRAVGLQIYT